jgi:DMSO/TMAO reductase YedYZ molybdopterin-dependent catalytic subunit
MARRPPIVGRFTREEVGLATRNSGMPLEALRYDVTPAGLHYLLIHFDIPYAEPGWRLEVSGLVEEPASIDLEDLKKLPSRTLRVTLECAGNGRGQGTPRYPSVPWLEEGVSTAEWTGVPLGEILRRARLREGARDIVFHGGDRGFDRGMEHNFARSLPPAEALRDDVLVAYAMNGAALLPQHGAPLRLIVPRWYGMASVKWLQRIEAIDKPFDGVQQASSYHFRRVAGDSLMVPPGIPDFYSRRRTVQAGATAIYGRAWSGSAAVERVEFGVNGIWREAQLEPQGPLSAWRGWRTQWDAAPGEWQLACRASDAAGNVQPLEPPVDVSGFGNNGVQRIPVTVRG